MNGYRQYYTKKAYKKTRFYFRVDGTRTDAVEVVLFSVGIYSIMGSV